MVGVIASVTTGRFGLSVWSFWNRVPTVPSPGVASADPADRQPRSPGRTVYLEGLHRIGRTGRDEPARRRTSGTNRLVSDDQGTQDAGEESHRAAPWSWRSRLFSKLVTSSLNWAGLRSTAPGLSDTSSAPGGSREADSSRTARTRLLRRLRTTAVPTFRVMAKATRVLGSTSAGPGR